MNPTLYLEDLFQRTSRPDGGTGAYGDFPPLESYNPRIDCGTPALLDFAIGAMLRVKTYTLKASYSVTKVTVRIYANDSYVVSTEDGEDGTESVEAAAPSGPLDLPANEGTILEGVPAEYPINDSILFRGFGGGQVFRPSQGDIADGKTVNFYLALLLNSALPDSLFPYVFTFSLGFGVENLGDDSGVITISAWGTEDLPAGDHPVAIKFLGKDFPGRTTYPDAPTSSGEPGDSDIIRTDRYNIYKPTKMEITAKDYWSYDGKYNTATGAPA